MKKLDENAKWWKGLETEWAYQDKNGDWWLIKNEKEKIQNNVSNIPAQNIISMGKGLKKIIAVVAFAALLGISLGLNVIQYFNYKSLEDAVIQQTIIKSSNLDHRD